MTLALRLLPVALAAALAAPKLAAAPAGDAPPPPPPLYRSVGPDGKVTFSDRRSNDTQAQTRTINRGQQYRPLFTPGLPLFESPQQAAATARRLHSPPQDGLAPAPAGNGLPLAPGLADALLIVTGHRFFVQVLLESCARAAPDGYTRYQIAVSNWRERNATVFARTDRVAFSEFSGEQRDQMRYTAQARLQPLLPRADADPAERRAWCDASAIDLSRRQHELFEDPRIAPIFEAGPR
jgi:hypothetical protein